MTRAFVFVALFALAISCSATPAAPTPPSGSAAPKGSSSASPPMPSGLAKTIASAFASAAAADSASPAASASAPPILSCAPPLTVLRSKIDKLALGMSQDEVERVLGPGARLALPAFEYVDEGYGTYWVGFVDPLGASPPKARGLAAVLYTPLGAREGCYLLPKDRRGDRAPR